MTPDEVISHPARVLTQQQRESYFELGYVHVEGIVGDKWLNRLRVAMDEFVERSRALAESDANIVLAPGHSSQMPRLRRINYAADNHPKIWEFASQSVLADIAADLLGPDVKFRESMLNFKWAGGGDEVKWHQDTSYPYTNDWPLQTLTSLYDVGPDQGPLMVIPASHKGEVYNRYDESGRWTGTIQPRDFARVNIERAVPLTGPAGSVTVIHMHVVHGSRRNDSDRSRPLLLCGYDPADAFPIRRLPMVSCYTGKIVRGAPAKYAHVESGLVQLPPDWDNIGYTSIYEIQQDERRSIPA
jgi:ectoine hydroxylase-related dioxygenase (phytanoyl-CoA dioxygenase family)